VEIEASGEVGGHDGGEPRGRGGTEGGGTGEQRARRSAGDGKAAEGGEGGFSCFIS